MLFQVLCNSHTVALPVFRLVIEVYGPGEWAGTNGFRPHFEPSTCQRRFTHVRTPEQIKWILIVLHYPTSSPISPQKGCILDTQGYQRCRETPVCLQTVASHSLLRGKAASLARGELPNSDTHSPYNLRTYRRFTR